MSATLLAYKSAFLSNNSNIVALYYSEVHCSSRSRAASSPKCPVMVQQKLKKPKAILFDVSGTAAKNSFIDKMLVPYFKTHTKFYLEENWDTPQAQEDIERIRLGPPAGGDAPKIPPKDGDKNEIIDAVANYVNYCSDKKIEPKGYYMLRFHVWFDGYDKGRLETPVYSDVAIQIQKWRCDMQILLYVFSNGWAEANKRFMGKTNHGDLNLLISGHFDTTTGPATEADTFKRLLGKIKQKPADVLFLTKSADEAHAASSVGIVCVLVMTHRRNIDKLEEADKAMPRIRSFNELEFED